MLFGVPKSSGFRSLVFNETSGPGPSPFTHKIGSIRWIQEWLNGFCMLQLVLASSEPEWFPLGIVF